MKHIKTKEEPELVWVSCPTCKTKPRWLKCNCPTCGGSGGWWESPRAAGKGFGGKR